MPSYAKLFFIFKCYSCGSLDKGKKWVYNLGTEYVVCWRCYERVLRKDYSLVKARRKHRFKDKIITLKEIPRIGVCNLCRAVVPFDCYRTCLHHDDNQYDENNTLKYTIESCDSCHNKESWRLGSFNGNLKYHECYACDHNSNNYKFSWTQNKGTDLFLCGRCKSYYSRNFKKRYKKF